MQKHLTYSTRSGYYNRLSQNELAVTPNCQNWLFYCLEGASPLAIPPITGKTRLPFTGWLILQNKPSFGEYVKRLLIQPRVRPAHPQNPLVKLLKSGYYNATTKLKAVKPNRHTLAIFMPTQGIACLYGGLIGVNTKPKGNSPSRLLAVVETCHPIVRAVLTKLKGAYQC